MKSLRITVVGGPFLPMPPAPCGAVERIWHGLAEEFVRRGHAVTVLCRRGPGQANDESVAGVRYVRRAGPAKAAGLRANLLKDLAYSLQTAADLPPADVTVTNTFWLPVLLSVWNRNAGRIAVHVARMPQRQHRLYPAVHRFQAVSHAIKDAIVRQNPGFGPRVKVFPNPIDTSRLVPPADGRAGRTEQTLLFTGRIHPEKGLDLLVAAFARIAPEFPRLRLKMVGPWRLEHGGAGEDYRDSLRQKAGGAAVEFGEPVFEMAALAEVYRGADYYCYPSVAEKGEAFGVAPLEAMAVGAPVVVSALACFRDFLEHGQNGVVFDHRAADPVGALAAALRAVIADPAEAARLGRAGVARAAEFSYAAVADQYLDDFAEMTRTGGPRRWAATRV